MWASRARSHLTTVILGNFLILLSYNSHAMVFRDATRSKVWGFKISCHFQLVLLLPNACGPDLSPQLLLQHHTIIVLDSFSETICPNSLYYKLPVLSQQQKSNCDMTLVSFIFICILYTFFEAWYNYVVKLDSNLKSSCLSFQSGLVNWIIYR